MENGKIINIESHFLSLGLSVSQAAKISSIFKSHLLLQRGEFFNKNTEICQKIGFVTEGVCRYYYDTEKGEITRWVSIEGDFVTTFGSFFAQKTATENIQAIIQTQIIYANFMDWNKLYNEEPFLRQLYTKTIEDQYKSMETRLFNMIALTAEQRYDWILKNHPKLNQQVSDKYLASILGITPRHLSRIRANFRVFNVSKHQMIELRNQQLNQICY